MSTASNPGLLRSGLLAALPDPFATGSDDLAVRLANLVAPSLNAPTHSRSSVMNQQRHNTRTSMSQVCLDVVSTLDYLSRGHRPGLTIYDALEEALRFDAADLFNGPDDAIAFAHSGDLPWDDPDPRRTAFEQPALHPPPAVGKRSTSAHAIHGALAVWAKTDGRGVQRPSPLDPSGT